MPDTQGYLDRISRIGQVLRAHNLGMELSLLSPLELGRGFTEATGESGRWVHYREGWRDPRTGEYVVEMWEQTRWTNNKGTIEPVRAGVRAFAFRERRVGGTRFYAVDPGDIVELNQAPEITAFDAEDPKAHQRRLRVHGRGDLQAGPRDRVLVVVSYTTPELDYFSPKALPFLEELVTRYHRAEVPLDGLYADEIHIQGDGAISITTTKASTPCVISRHRWRAASPKCTDPSSPISNGSSSTSASGNTPSCPDSNPGSNRST